MGWSAYQAVYRGLPDLRDVSAERLHKADIAVGRKPEVDFFFTPELRELPMLDGLL